MRSVATISSPQGTARETEPNLLRTAARHGGQSLDFWDIIEHQDHLCPDMLRRTLFLKHTHTFLFNFVTCSPNILTSRKGPST